MKQIINRQVRSHTRFDPRLNKRVDVKTYNRRQEVNIYKPITRAKAEEVFLSKSKKAQSVDLSRNAKTILETPTEEWLKKSSNIDIRGLDTLLEKRKNLSTISTEDLEDMISVLKTKINKLGYGNPETNKLIEERQELEIEVFNRKYMQGEDIGKLLSNGELGKIPLNARIKLPSFLKTTFDKINSLNGVIEKEKLALKTYEDELEHEELKNEPDKMKIKEIKVNIDYSKIKLKEAHERLSVYVPKSLDSYEIYVNDKLKSDLFETFSKLEVLPNEPVLEKRVKKIKKQMIERGREKDFEKYQEVYKTIKQYTKEFFPKENIELTGEKTIGAMDLSHITYITTPGEFKGSFFEEQTKNRKPITSLESENIFITKNGEIAIPLGDSYYDIKYVNIAKKQFKNKNIEIFAGKELPLIIKSNEIIYAVAPRGITDNWGYDEDPDNPDIIYTYGTKAESTWNVDAVKINSKDFKKLNKLSRPKLVEKANEEGIEVFRRDMKNKILFDYIIHGGK